MTAYDLRWCYEAAWAWIEDLWIDDLYTALAEEQAERLRLDAERQIDDDLGRQGWALVSCRMLRLPDWPEWLPPRVLQDGTRQRIRGHHFELIVDMRTIRLEVEQQERDRWNTMTTVYACFVASAGVQRFRSAGFEDPLAVVDALAVGLSEHLRDRVDIWRYCDPDKPIDEWAARSMRSSLAAHEASLEWSFQRYLWRDPC